MVKAITFDLDGVYFLRGKENFIANLGRIYGVSEDEAKRVFLKSEQMNELYKTGKMGDEEFWSWAATEWRISASPTELMDLLIEGYEANEHVVEVVKTVRQKGYKTLICSSNFPARISGLQKRFGFLDNFDAWALSYEVGFNKPDKKLFEELIRKSGVEASEIAFADDFDPTVESAKSVGISAFLYTDFEQFMGEIKKLGVEV
ncbi:HAD-IA family hydrolase [Candidatus Shapirobacteria bacterium]|nr:HAD-IA family hydrolase [Candidatus Shapirobacteria bacterium]